jgi:hypothetical protein
MNPAEYENLSVEQFKAKFGRMPSTEEGKLMMAAVPTNDAWRNRTPVPMKIGASVPAPQSTPQGEATPAPYKMPNDAANRNTQQMLKDWGSRVNGPSPFPTAPIGDGAAPVLPVTPPAPADESWQGKLKSAFGIGQEKTTPAKPSEGAGWGQDSESLADQFKRKLGIVDYKGGAPVSPATAPKAAPTPAPTAPAAPAVPPVAPVAPVAPVLPTKSKPADNPAVKNLKAKAAAPAPVAPLGQPGSYLTEALGGTSGEAAPSNKFARFATGDKDINAYSIPKSTQKISSEDTGAQAENIKLGAQAGSSAAYAKTKAAQDALTGIEGAQGAAGKDKATQIKNYLGQLDANQRAEFWQGLIHSLGKITAGVVGRAQGADVAGHYKPTSVFNVDTANKAAKERFGAESAQTDERMQQAVERLKAGGQLQGEMGAIPFTSEQKMREQLANLPGTKKETTTGSEIQLVNKGGQAAKAKGPDESYARLSGRSREDAMNAAATKEKAWLASGVQNIPPTGNTPNERADNFSLIQQYSGEAPDVLKKLYMLMEKSGKNPKDASDTAIEIIHKSRRVPSDMHSDQGREWYDQMQRLLSAGIDFGTLPDEVTQHKSGGIASLYKENDPYDTKNPNSWINKPGNREKLAQEQGQTGAPAPAAAPTPLQKAVRKLTPDELKKASPGELKYMREHKKK